MPLDFEEKVNKEIPRRTMWHVNITSEPDQAYDINNFVSQIYPH